MRAFFTEQCLDKKPKSSCTGWFPFCVSNRKTEGLCEIGKARLPVPHLVPLRFHNPCRALFEGLIMGSYKEMQTVRGSVLLIYDI